jgi:class 3 adenylate cyclase/YHS domain-containing protein
MEKDVAILMADLTGYTAMTDIHGGASAARIVNKYMQLVEESRFGTTQVVQRIGDQVVMIAEIPVDLVTTAQKLITIAHEQDFLSIHMGIHYGPILIDNGNLFGSTINLASRIMNHAKGGQILCSSAYVNELAPGVEFKFISIGKHKFKNVLSHIEIFELSTIQSNPFYIDPVCHMLVDPGKEDHVVTYQNETFHFCSNHCMNLFTAYPESFLHP